MVRILPHGLGDHQWRGGRNLAKNGHSLALAGNETVAGIRSFLMSADDLVAGLGDGAAERGFHLLLGRPTFLIGREPKIAAGNQVNFLSVPGSGVFVSHGSRSSC